MRTVDARFVDVPGVHAGRVKVGKLDVDESPDLAQRYGVQSIPTLLVFKDGRVVEQRIGALPKAEMARMLDAHATVSAAVRA
jgi:thioredoxin 1